MDLIWTAFLLGLVGSLHCAGMCGPLALALPVPAGGPASFVWGRVVYNVGRLTTYAALGLLFGIIGRSLHVAGLQRGVSIVLGVLLLVGLGVSRRVALSRPVVKGVNRLKSAMGGWLRTRSYTALGVLGMLTGLLPCGLVYAACLGATVTGSIASGVGYMVAFGVGTVPMILALGLSGRLLQASLRQHLFKLVPLSVALVATVLILRGMSLGIPYLSPDITGGHGGGCCAPSMVQP